MEKKEAELSKFIHSIMKLYLSIIFLFLSFNVFGQADSLRIDSLKRALFLQKEDTNKVQSLYELSMALSKSFEGDSAVLYGKQSLALATRTNNKKGIGYGNIAIGVGHLARNSYNESVKALTEALTIMQQIDYKPGIALAYDNRGYTYLTSGDFGNAQTNFFSALKLYQEIHNRAGEGRMLTLIGGTYYFQGDIEEAINTNVAAIKIMEEIDNPKGVAQAHFNNAEYYLTLDKYTAALNEYISSLNHYVLIKERLYGVNSKEYYKMYVSA